MRNPRMIQRSAIGIGVVFVAAALGYVALAADSAKTEKIPAAVDSSQYAAFMENEAFDLEDLAEGAEIQRRFFNRITPPGTTLQQPMFPLVVPFDAKNFGKKFLSELIGKDKNSVAIYPLSLALDPKTRETIVYNAEGKLIATLAANKFSHNWPVDADPIRVTLKLDLLPSEDVEPYMYTERRIAESVVAPASKAAKAGGIALKSLGVGDFGICKIHKMTNGTMRLTVTNGSDAAELFSYTVWHTSAVVVATWTNEESNVVTDTNTLWHPVSPPFNGLESAWECRTTNLLLTNGVGVWDDTNVSSNARVRFYGVANRIDTDEDGLTDGAEKFVHHTNPDEPDTDGDDLTDYEEVTTYETDPLNPDTDGDGLSDGWETQNNLNPNSSVGTDGSNGDPDGDSLSNAEEQDLDTNPQVGDQVNLLGSTDVALEYRSIESKRNKYGFTEYTNASTPPRYYLKENGTYYWLTTQPQQEPPREKSAALTHVVDANTGEVSGGWTGFYDQAGSDDQCHRTYFTNQSAGSYRGETLPRTLTQTHLYYLIDEDDDPDTYLNCSGYHDGQAHRYLTCTIDLANEYTTDLLLSLTTADLDNYGSLANIGWGEGRKWVPTGYVSCAVSTASLRDMSANEFNTNNIDYKLSMAKIGYRFKTVNRQSGQIYRLNWAEYFTPEGGGTATTFRTLSAVILGNGGTQYIENASYVINPPETDGTIEPVALKVDLDVSNTLLTLMDTYKLTAVVTPSNGISVSEYTFEIKRDSSSSWYQLYRGPQPSFEAVAKVAGYFDLRVTATVSGKARISQEQDVEMQFPAASDIIAEQGVQARMDQAWEDTKNAATPLLHREEGYYITLNTITGGYGIAAHSIGTPVDYNHDPEWDTATYPRPSDSITYPSPLDQPTYTIGWFHTHTPMTYAPVGTRRGVGPSEGDYGWSANVLIDLPGYVYDYTESPTGYGSIPAGHPIDSLAHIFMIAPPDRRSTPIF